MQAGAGRTGDRGGAGEAGKDLARYLPMWEKLTAEDQGRLQASAALRKARAGAMVHSGGSDCLGLLAICEGQLRVFILSEEGREVTLYRLFAGDICLFTASCVMKNLQFDLMIQAEKDTTFWVIPAPVYRSVTERSAPLANYTNELMAAHLSEVMWLMEQILWGRMDQRLAAFLLEESELEESDRLRITHERIANHLGTAREVVTRMLRYFQSEGMVRLARGTIELLDKEKLEQLSAAGRPERSEGRDR